TKGHLDVIARCAGLYDRVVVGVVLNPSKQSMFTSEERLAMLRETCAEWPHVECVAFAGLLVDCAREVGAEVIVKGLRAMTDFDYELQLAQMNRHLSGIVTMFVATAPSLGYLSSSLVKEVAMLGGDVDELVPPIVAAALKERMAHE
ncbi:MAG: pantetheine-phosphate adenylyltransferase, partial [Actinomycetota bacterium]